MSRASSSSSSSSSSDLAAAPTLSSVVGTAGGRGDDDDDAATSEAARKEAASKFRATTWNTKVPDLQARLRKMKREEPPATKGLIAGTLLFLTVNCCLVLNFLGG